MENFLSMNGLLQFGYLLLWNKSFECWEVMDPSQWDFFKKVKKDYFKHYELIYNPHK